MIHDFSGFIARLNCASESEHYVVRYCLRDPYIGKGNGPRGVANHLLTVCYIENLERLYAALSGPLVGWIRKPALKTQVHLLDLDDLPDRSPLAALDSHGVPFIVLPCRSLEPSPQMAQQRAAVEAIHEGTHTFSFTSRNFQPPSAAEHLVADQWYWFNEATSVFMEGFLMPTNPESIRFVRNWSDSPHIPLDRPSAVYESGMFARYLARRFDPGLIAEMWNRSAPLETPFDILDSLVASREPHLKSPDPKNRCPIFREYCVDSYFVWDHRSVGFAADVYARFGNRALAESVRPEPGKPVQLAAEVDHLACHYYRVWLACGVQSIQIELSTHSPEVNADAAVIKRDTGRDPVQPVAPATVLAPLNLDTVDHIIIVVSNTGLGAWHDAQPYTLRITARVTPGQELVSSDTVTLYPQKPSRRKRRASPQ